MRASGAVAKWKLEKVEELARLIRDYPVVGIVNMENIPARTLQKMRAKLRGEVLIKMSKKSIMQHAIEKAAKEEKSLADLKDKLRGQPAFIFSKINPFKLYKILEENKVPAPAKPNSIAPRDIVVPKGETPFAPGPLLGELQALGIQTEIKGGKIAVKKDTVVARAGDVIDAKLANILNRLGIEPMEVGLDLIAAYEAGTVFSPEVLRVDEEEVKAQLALAYQQAVNLSINSGFLTRETAPLAIAKAYREALALALEAAIPEPGAVDRLLAKAHLQMLSLASRLGDSALDDELRRELSSAAPAAQEPAKKEAEEKAEEEEKKEEAEEEEEAAAGLGALFG
ncbi:MAG: 50S ribosomal protein L10 [Euryarchaeota archaeon]|nr:50S ribosomal protein L10 [Euryarchaeota archaeon]